MARSYLTLGVLSTLGFLVVSALVFSNVTQAADGQLALAVNHASLGAAFTTLMVVAAEYGREYFWIPVVAIMLILGNRRTKLLAFELAALFIIGIAAGEILKITAIRPRPFESINTIITRVPTDLDSSYPSGHALIVTIGAAFSMLTFRKKVVGLLFVVEAAIVCYSRVYVGMHYPLDVVGGVFLGIGIVGVGLFIMERYLGRLLAKITSAVTKKLSDGPLDL
ncbi:MAG TPA: phosphatase PAP2 family protein [Nitrososphaerales archaeon]|nr:phosphatase PAP2 family protein [Nitrososphaerales archaeon]